MKPVDLRDPDTGRVLFSHDELACPLTGIVRLQPRFDASLIKLRLAFGEPMVVTSCCRSAAYNRMIRDAHPRSLHVYDAGHHGAEGTLAIDIARPDSGYTWKLMRAAVELRWSVGMAKTFIHLDRRDMVGLHPAGFGY